MKILYSVNFTDEIIHYYVNGIMLWSVSIIDGEPSEPCFIGHVLDRLDFQQVVKDYMLTEEYIASLAVYNSIEKLKATDEEFWGRLFKDHFPNEDNLLEYTISLLKNAEWKPYDCKYILEGHKGYITNDLGSESTHVEINPDSIITYKLYNNLITAFTEYSEDICLTKKYTVAVIDSDDKLIAYSPGDPVLIKTITDLSLINVTELGSKAIERGFTHARIMDKSLD